MKVTAIKLQVKRADRYSIFVDEVYSFSLNEFQLAESGLSVGRALSTEELENLKNDSDFGKAYERVLNYLSLRSRSQKEIEDYLARTYLYPKPKSYINKAGERVFKKQTVDKLAVNRLIERVMERLQSKGYVNDADFAFAWARSRQLSGKTSQRKLTQELKIKGIADDIIQNTLQELDFDDTDSLKNLIAKKRQTPRYQDDTKLTQFLLQRGFNYDAIKAVIKDSQDD